MKITMYRNAFSCMLFLISAATASAVNKHPAMGTAPVPLRPPKIEFVENKGQWIPDAKFKAAVPNGVMFITDKGFVYNYTSASDMENWHELCEAGKDVSGVQVRGHAYKVSFLGANTDIRYVASDKSSTYQNFLIGSDKSKWASNVGVYGQVEQQNIYNGINAVVYSKGSSVKYDFTIAPGADPNQIRLSFEGIDPQLTEKGDISIKTAFCEVTEQAPYAYQVVNGVEKKIATRYKLEKGVVSFELLEDYDHRLPLVIDPVLVFATYSGGTSSYFYAYSTTYDKLGNMYTAAYSTPPTSGWPVTTGAYKTSAAGFYGTVCINKYNATGSSLVYSTYFGGNGSCWANAMRVNNLNELVIVGSTDADSIGVTQGAYQPLKSGGLDFYMARFNVNGTGLVACTYLGGLGTEGALVDIYNAPSPLPQAGLSSTGITSPWELVIDQQNNTWVVGNTNSINFPVTSSAFQNTLAGGYDGVVFKLSGDCKSLLYSSYFGGTANDALYGIELMSNGKIVVTGGTQSTNITTTPGTLHTASQGGWDGYLAVINPAQSTLVASTYLGTTGNDNGTKLQVDKQNNIYVLGRTSGDYPITTGVYAMPGTDVFIDKINPSLTASLMSTRVGSAYTNAVRYLPTAFLLDICQNIYVAGLTPNYATANMPLTPDAFDANAKPFWFCVLKPDFSGLLFGSYYGIGGSDHPHCGTSRMDPQGIVYHSFCSATTGFTGTAGSWSPTKQNGSMNDNFSFKFNFGTSGVNSDFLLDPTTSAKDSGCAPYSVHFLNTSTQALQYTWDFGDSSPFSHLNNPTHVYTTPGIYTVSLHASNPQTCVTDDTAFMTITVLQAGPPDFSVSDTILCSFEQNINIGLTLHNPSPNDIIHWGPASGIVGASNVPEITINPNTENVYYVIVKDTIPGICGFSRSDTIHINMRPRILDILNSDTVVCEGTVVPVTAVGGPGYVFRWTPSTGVSDSTALSPSITINQPNIYILTGHYPGCPDTSVTLNIGMQAMPHLRLSSDKWVCQGTDVALESNVTPYRNDYTYGWTPATSNLSNPTGPDTHFIADSTITYQLRVATPIGCTDSNSVTVTVYPGGFGSISPDTGYCPGIGAYASIRANGGATYQWSPAEGLSDTTIAAPVATPHASTEYTVLITDAHHCTDTEKVMVRVYPAAELNIPDSINLYPGETYHMEPNTNCSYFAWFPPSGLSNDNISDPAMSPAVRTRYFVTARTENGCVIKDSVDVLVKETVIDMPNAFQPNGGANSVFKPAKRGIAKLNSFIIFNRWGNKVYSGTNPDEGWDGTYNGKPQPAGVYIYVIDAVTDSGQPFIRKGNVTLLR